jgi:hypothetical protein
MLLTLAVPLFALADTVILKSGRKIEASKCWQEAGMIRCRKLGQIIGFSENEVATVTIDKKVTAPSDGFSFDIWKSGLTVAEAIDVAQEHDIPLHKSGIISINKHFNPKMCLPYASSATEFEYNTHLLGRQAKIALKFTPTSKKLYSIKVTWSGPGISKKSEFRDRVEAMLIEKYGRAVKTKNHIVYKTYDFQIDQFSIVTMRPGGNYVLLEYLDKRLVRRAEDEKTAKVRSGFTRDDKGKF